MGTAWVFLAAAVLLSAQAQTSDYAENIKKVFGTPDNPIVKTNASVISTTTDKFNLSPTNFPDKNDTGNEIHTCKTDDSKDGECVPYYLCDSESRKLITDGTTLIDIRVKDRACNYLEVCCLHAQVTDQRPEPEVRNSGQCGFSNPGATPFRIKTEFGEAQFGEFPWMVAILKKTSEGTPWMPSNYLGGGSLIHPSVVLTSAHKVDSLTAGELIARAGEWDTNTEDETYPHQERDLRKLVVHEEFYRPSVLNSVALLFLKSPFVLAPHIDVVCLGHALPQPGTRCFSMGWGKDDFGETGKNAVILKKVEVPLVSRTSCRDSLRGTRLGAYFQLHSSFMCAGGERGRDTCRGDGGAPLVCSVGKVSDGKFAQYGAVAWGIGCGDDRVPGVYVNVAGFRAWIEARLKDEGLDPAVFDYAES